MRAPLLATLFAVASCLCYTAASGIASGVASALTQTVTVLFGQTGLGAPLAVVIIANPLAAGAIGILRLGERFIAGVPGIALAAGCALLLGYGVTVLAAHAPEDRPVAPST